MIWGSYNSSTQVLPFVSCASGSSTLPFAANPNFGAASPFNANVAAMSTYAFDSCSIDYINTQSPINVSGKLTVSVFY